MEQVQMLKRKVKQQNKMIAKLQAAATAAADDVKVKGGEMIPPRPQQSPPQGGAADEASARRELQDVKFRLMQSEQRHQSEVARLKAQLLELRGGGEQ